MVLDKRSALKIVRKTLLADFAAEEGDLDNDGVFIRQARDIEGARHFPIPEHFLDAVTMGAGVIVCCTADRLSWVKEHLGGLTRDAIFDADNFVRLQNYVSRDGQEIRIELKYICTRDTFRPRVPEQDIELRRFEKDRMQYLYQNNLFPNALGSADNPGRPHMIAAAAVCGGELAGVAAATADCDAMWQIGVDTLPAYRRRGIAQATVGAVTDIILSKNILPYYSTRFYNVASRRTAVSLGYFPAWVEAYSRDKHP
jgi:GNAT superfamily N-acetyltransferase